MEFDVTVDFCIKAKFNSEKQSTGREGNSWRSRMESNPILLRAAAHQLRQDKHQYWRQKTQSCFIRDSDSSPHTEVARVCVLLYLL
jgi:hypothetical protein